MLLTLIHNLTPSPDETTPDKKEMALFKKQKDWVGVLFDRINWERTHPGVIGFLWFRISDHARDLLFAKREQFKLSIPAVKNYYLSKNLNSEEASKIDLRLLNFILDRLIEDDNIKMNAWRGLFNAANTIKERNFIDEKYSKPNQQTLRAQD